MLDQILVIVSLTLLVMVSPGPDMVLVLRNTFAGGRHAGLQTSIGILSGNLVHITYCVFGIGLLISQSIVAFSALKFAGARIWSTLGSSAFDLAPGHSTQTFSAAGGPIGHGSFRDSSTISSTPKARFSIWACLRQSLPRTRPRAPCLCSSSP